MSATLNPLNPGDAYAELAAASNFSFLRGASHPKDLVLTAILRGHAGLGLADRNTVAGVVRAWSALRDLRFGAVEITVHNAQVVQIERKEKFRLQQPGNKPG